MKVSLRQNNDGYEEGKTGIKKRGLNKRLVEGERKGRWININKDAIIPIHRWRMQLQ